MNFVTVYRHYTIMTLHDHARTSHTYNSRFYSNFLTVYGILSRWLRQNLHHPSLSSEPVSSAVRAAFKFHPPKKYSALVTNLHVIRTVSTALALLSSPRYAQTHITILDSRTPYPTSPPPHLNPFTASIDSSRLTRADYAVPAYAALAASAQKLWQSGWAGNGRYHESGLAFVAHRDGGLGERYVKASLENVLALQKERQISKQDAKDALDEDRQIDVLSDRLAVETLMRGTEGGSGEWGYVNRGSGWVDAAGAIEEARRKVNVLGKQRGGLEWAFGQAERLLFSDEPRTQTSSPPASVAQSPRTVTGVLLSDGTRLTGDLVVLATGAWTPLLLDVRSRLIATGQILSYVQLSPPEAARLADIPALLNESTGMFLVPPTPDGMLKVARHGYGYRNPVRIPDPERRTGSGDEIEVSVPAADFTTMPAEGQAACRAALRELVPWLGERPFAHTRVCWYADTPSGDFLVDYVPRYGKSLMVATGGSGHGFKFLPVLGQNIVERMEGRSGGELSRLWSWGEGLEGFTSCEDGSRGGTKGMIWKEEIERAG